MQTEYTGNTKNVFNYNRIFDHAALPASSLKVSVIVPARNESKNLRKTLDALRLQTDTSGTLLNQNIYEVLLLVNNCSDQTFTIAQNYQKKYPEFSLHIAEVTLPAKKANIGFVRRLLMDTAHHRLTTYGNCTGIIASTDGDTQVDACWVYHIMQEIAKGCDAVGGRILTQSNRKKARLYHLRDVAYRSLLARAEALIDPEEHDPWPRHYQYFGASMAVTCAVYEQVGRLPEVPFLEDNAFHQALQRMDVRIRKTPAVKAYTSTRMSGRVKVGFSEQLRRWSGYIRYGYTQEVEPPKAWLIKFKSKRVLRQCREEYLKHGFYNREAFENVAKDLLVNPQWLHNELIANQYFGLLWEKVRKKIGKGKWGKKWELVHITEAIQELRAFVNVNGVTSSQTNRA
ncbi:glycosyltransferase [Mucilaginibacter arboris]|uniref:Glycosyltransferase n=1 Tax=Mucilaginibacter arboris TaxID=2682090 RepID=A0A7K1SYV1_9SPHI|nr:glycosyltransferase family 2 protein [Mucilaginibacter arboris]MVN22489.1 glycosyltransferase [Mucilaginibacter arboris]